MNGANTATQSNWPPANAAAAASVLTPWKLMSFSVMPSVARPWSSRKWSTTPASAATVLPFRSSIEVIDWSQMTASLPVELSSTTTIFCSEPEATAKIVSFSVWALTSSCPATRASSEAV